MKLLFRFDILGLSLASYLSGHCGKAEQDLVEKKCLYFSRIKLVAII